jgi:hypothetical protein
MHQGPSAFADGLFLVKIGLISLRRIFTMRVRVVSSLLVLLFFFCVFTGAQEPVKPPLTPRIITATKQVTQFTALEMQLLQAVQKKDKAAVESLITDEFAIQMPNADPLPGEDWLGTVMAKDYSLKSFLMRQFSVADLGESAVVVFDRIQQAIYKVKSDSGEFFVVDLWKKTGDSWKLANRYVSKVSSVIPAPRTVRKPTGKQ